VLCEIDRKAAATRGDLDLVAHASIYSSMNCEGRRRKSRTSLPTNEAVVNGPAARSRFL